MPSVLFVCTANICRSPLAAALFRQKVMEKGSIDEWRIESAGTWALEGQPAAEKSQHVLMEKGIEIKEHRSRLVTREMLEKFDLILTMEKNHQEALQIEFPKMAEKIYLLREMVGEKEDIADPIGGSLVDYEETAQELETIFKRGYERIFNLARIKPTIKE
jgi:protein-tyrosine-phosphatase